MVSRLRTVNKNSRLKYVSRSIVLSCYSDYPKFVNIHKPWRIYHCSKLSLSSLQLIYRIDGSEEIHKKMIANECQFRLTHRISCHKKIQFICVEIHNTKSSNSIESEPSWEVVWNCQNPHSISFAYLNLRTCTSWNCSSPSYACRI